MAKNHASAVRTKRATTQGRLTRVAEKAQVVPLRRPEQKADGEGALLELGVVDSIEKRKISVIIPRLGLEPCAVRSLLPFADLEPEDQVVLARLGGKKEDFVILGRLFDPGAPARDVNINGRRVTIEANTELVMRCAAATIRVGRDGLVAVRGDRITTEARRTNRIRGGSVEIN